VPVDMRVRVRVDAPSFDSLFAVRFWDADRMRLVNFFIVPFAGCSPTPSIRSLAFSARGDQIAVGFENSLIEIYSTMCVVERTESIE
jgi:hypothetical protein